jgi:4-alpha-glucanotransferase
MKDALQRIYGNVLLMRDLGDPAMFVPRILGCDTEAYAQLSQAQRIAYDRIYEDYFYNRHTMFWYREGMRKLTPLLLSTPMTACGEDLGMIPACVPWVMKNLQVLSLEIQRMPKLYGETFARPEHYPYLSVATPSTHDMSTLRGWWREDEVLSQQFYNCVLGFDGKAPLYADEQITGYFKKLSFPGDCAQNFWDWIHSNIVPEGTDPLLALMESLKWCFRLSCHIAVSYLQKIGYRF